MEKMLVHEMVPKHEVLSEKDADKILEQLNVSRDQLPGILLNDPALKGLNAKNGDIIRVTRNNPVTGTSYAYRVVGAY